MLVSAQELQGYMSDVNLTPKQVDSIEDVLSGVQSELETYCNRPLETVQVRQVVRTDLQGVVALNVTPIWKVISVTSLGYSIPPTSSSEPYIPAPMERDPLIGDGAPMEDSLVPGLSVGAPVIVPGGVWIGYPGGYYSVEYVGGWNLKLENSHYYEGVRNAIKRVAAREITGLHDDTLSLRESNAEKASEPDTRQKGWTTDELKQWDRLRRRTVL